MVIDPLIRILKKIEKGKYDGEIADRIVKNMLEEIHNALIDNCKHINKKDSIKLFYNYFDQSCEKNIGISMWVRENKETILDYASYPTMFRYIIECILYVDSSSTNKLTITKEREIILLSYYFLILANFSNYLFYNKYKGGIQINADLTYEFIIPEKTLKIQDKYLNDIRLQKERMLYPDKYLSRKKRIKTLKELFAEFDEPFHNKYAILFSDVGKVIETLFKLLDENVVEVGFSSLITKLYRKTGFSRSYIKKILSLFEFNPSLLQTDWKYFKFYSNKHALSIKPIIRFSGEYGENGKILFGRHALLRSATLLHHYISTNVIDLGIDFSQANLRKGQLFENKIRKEIKQYNLIVKNIKYKKNREEIDAIIYNGEYTFFNRS